MAISMAASRANALSLEEALSDVETNFVKANPRSALRFEDAVRHLPGGNTRSILHYDPFPLVLAKGEQQRVSDIDGHSYVDFLGEYSAGLYGHSHPVIVEAVRRALEGGIVLGGANPYETELARLLRERFPSCDRVRFCNSGTEANMMALMLARAATGRAKVLGFRGAYHGSGMAYPVRGPQLNLPFEVVLAPFNEPAATSQAILEHAADFAAVIIEPMMGGGGCIPADPDFLRMLRRETLAHGIALIFDEVMTSRCSTGGLQEALGIRPDLTTFGKYLGGGMSIGAFGGRLDLMKRFDPTSGDALPHSGTFNNNVLSMAAGAAGLTSVLTADAIKGLNARAARFREGLEKTARKNGVPLIMTGAGSIQCMHFQEEPVRSPEDVVTSPEWRKLIHLALLERGFYTARRGYSALSLMVDDSDIDQFVAAFDDVLATYASAFPR